ncbi:MAG TPA: 3-phosphoshikimate 1-carboxyvinyltransferase [Pyrinomonadaceae bacterium]|nr:3-phosphoshikimate 1-carboxyvinyltransferase [Pyrinomonadaceae bacterium]
MIIRPARRIRGRLEMPGDKSISHRAAMIAALARGTSRLKNFSTSADCAATLRCLAELGVSIERERHEITVEGAGLNGLRSVSTPLDCGNSGTTMRLLAGILAGQDFSTSLTGDASLRARPMARIIEPLQMMGAEIDAQDGHAPLTIRGRKSLQAIQYELLLASAQVKSCILLAGLYAGGPTTVSEEVPTRDHTERMMRWFGVAVTTGEARHENEVSVTVSPGKEFMARDVEIPGDVSSAAYFVAAALLLEGSELEIANVGLNPHRIRFLKQLNLFGLAVNAEEAVPNNYEPVGTIRSNGMRATQLPQNPQIINGTSVPALIDEIPLLAIAGSQIEGGVEIRDARELRIKESDRIASTVAGLRAMGAAVEEFDDGLRVSGPARLQGASIDPHGDHRIAMAFTVAGLIAEGETEIKNPECVAVSFPEFFESLDFVTER